MVIGSRLRELRREKNLTQRDMEESMGLARCYVSRVEHGTTVPSLETLHRFAAALSIPLYQIFYAPNEPSRAPVTDTRRSLQALACEPGREGAEARWLLQLQELIGRLSEQDRVWLLDLAHKLANRHRDQHRSQAHRDGRNGEVQAIA